MKVFVHTCCGPCLLYPLDQLALEGSEVTAYFYNPNIHPYMEHERRVKALQEVASEKGVRVLWDIPPEGEDYGITAWLVRMRRKRETGERCPECYRMRLERTARVALAMGFGAFTTTLLYSRYQMHNLIKLMGFSIGNKYGLDFIYRDFRAGWQKGIDMSIEMGIYRQPYCGCIYSEQERYAGRAEKLYAGLARENDTGDRAP